MQKSRRAFDDRTLTAVALTPSLFLIAVGLGLPSLEIARSISGNKIAPHEDKVSA
jgi:hypothetical protein